MFVRVVVFCCHVNRDSSKRKFFCLSFVELGGGGGGGRIDERRGKSHGGEEVTGLIAPMTKVDPPTILTRFSVPFRPLSRPPHHLYFGVTNLFILVHSIAKNLILGILLLTYS